ncbi:MAG: HD domain-containing protein [Ruminiclostridium sp.]|nr:HD domain-containing protein [Ruminiclostridium sp.]
MSELNNNEIKGETTEIQGSSYEGGEAAAVTQSDAMEEGSNIGFDESESDNQEEDGSETNIDDEDGDGNISDEENPENRRGFINDENQENEVNENSDNEHIEGEEANPEGDSSEDEEAPEEENPGVEDEDTEGEAEDTASEDQNSGNEVVSSEEQAENLEDESQDIEGEEANSEEEKPEGEDANPEGDSSEDEEAPEEENPDVEDEGPENEAEDSASEDKEEKGKAEVQKKLDNGEEESESDDKRPLDELDIPEKNNERDLLELTEQVTRMTKPYHDKAGEVAKKSPDLKTYRDHREEHVMQVAEKSQMTADAFEKVAQDHPSYSDSIDRKELQVAALFHDTGMDGGYNADPDNGNGIRKEHSLNSAIHVLENRESIEELGVNPNLVAVDCMAHSKSCSGISDLTDKIQWTECLDKIDAAVDEYNKAHPDKHITFDKSALTNGEYHMEDREVEDKATGKVEIESKKVYEFNEQQLGKSASTAAALRISDANRDAPENPKTQAGEDITVDPVSFKKNAVNWEDEISEVRVQISGELLDNKNDPGGFGRMYSVGEGNLSSLNCAYDETRGQLTETFTVKDGSSFPKCTQNCIKERFKEFETISGIDYSPVIEFEGSYSTEMRADIEKTYNEFKDIALDRYGINIQLSFKEDEDGGN